MKTNYVTFNLVTINGHDMIQNVNYVATKKAADNYVYNSQSSTYDPCDIAMSMTEKEYEIFKKKIEGK